MGTASYVLVGTPQAEEATFASTCHGAGRTMSRSEAMKKTDGKELLRALSKKGISVMAENPQTLGEEAPQAYKDIEEVIESELDLIQPVVKLQPLGVVKG